MPGESARINGRKGGRPKGTKLTKTLEKEEIRARVREHVSRHLQPLLEAQTANALGLKYLVKREKDGKFTRIGPDGVDGEGVIEVWEKDPSTQAFTDLMNRAADKPTEMVELKVAHALEEKLAEGRARNAAAEAEAARVMRKVTESM